MKKNLKLAYFYQLGTNYVQKLKLKFEKGNDMSLTLIPLAYDAGFSALKYHKVDLLLTDVRDTDLSNLACQQLFSSSLMALVPQGVFSKGMQTLDLNSLSSLTSLIVAKPGEEVAELHYQRDYLQLKSDFLAVNNIDEAILMAKSGSGFVLINEQNSAVLACDELQKLFLLSNKVQLRQNCSLIALKDKQKLLANLLTEIR